MEDLYGQSFSACERVNGTTDPGAHSFTLSRSQISGRRGLPAGSTLQRQFLSGVHLARRGRAAKGIMPRLAAPDVHEDRSGGVTIAVAMLLRIQRETPTERDVEQWVQKIDAAMAPVFGADANSPVGITIRVAGKSGQRITEDLILGAAEDCATYVRRARGAEPTRTVHDHRTTRIWTAIILAWLPLLVKMSTRVLSSHRRAPAAASSEPRHARSTDRR